VRRYVDELADVDGAYVVEPWLLPENDFAALGYPAPIVDQMEAEVRLRWGRRATGGARVSGRPHPGVR
jgi:deoxyribodipyrimidine photo-lyase